MGLALEKSLLLIAFNGSRLDALAVAAGAFRSRHRTRISKSFDTVPFGLRSDPADANPL